MATQYAFGKIVTDGLVLALDASDRNSYVSGSTTWRDLSGNNNSGSLINGPTYSSDSSGNIVFDGVNDYAQLTSTISSINGTTEASLAMWLKLNSGSNQANTAGIIQLSGYNVSNGCLYYFTDATRVGGIWLDIFRTDRVFTGDWQPTFNGTKWHNLIVTTTPGTNGWKMYLNANLSYQTTGQSTVSVDSSLFGGFMLGRNSSSRYLAGNISSCYIYNRALSAQEILQNYNANKSKFGL